MQAGTRSCVVAVGLLVITFGQHVRAGAPAPGPNEVPKVILSGLQAYKAEGPEAAVKVWIKGSPMERSKEALSQANVLRQIQDFYRAYKTFQLVRSRNLTPTTQVIYLALDYEKGPLFAKFVVYRTDPDWVLAYFNFNTKEELVFPNCP